MRTILVITLVKMTLLDGWLCQQVTSVDYCFTQNKIFILFVYFAVPKFWDVSWSNNDYYNKWT